MSWSFRRRRDALNAAHEAYEARWPDDDSPQWLGAIEHSCHARRRYVPSVLTSRGEISPGSSHDVEEEFALNADPPVLARAEAVGTGTLPA